MYSTVDVIDEDERCEKSPSGKHEPDWNTVSVSKDWETHIDINCKHCGFSGCIGNQSTLESGISW